MKISNKKGEVSAILVGSVCIGLFLNAAITRQLELPKWQKEKTIDTVDTYMGNGGNVAHN